jgi:D-glycero-D-manno-heptose 1,7-bisphosphate phosphatase
MAGARARVALVDRDGVINRMRPDHVKRWDEFEVLPGALEALARLSTAGLDVVILTNQSAIGRGLVSRQTVDEMHGRLRELVRQRGGDIRAFLVCPHTPSDGCDCRKPAPGLLFRARDELGIDLVHAIMVGDQRSDVDAASAAGCRAILIRAQTDPAKMARSDGCPVVSNLAEAADLILGMEPG